MVLPEYAGDRKRIEQLGTAVIEFSLNAPSAQDQALLQIRSSDRELSAYRPSDQDDDRLWVAL